MNIFLEIGEDDKYTKMYISSLKKALCMIEGEVSSIQVSDIMKAIMNKFPYFLHTTPKIMAIAVSLSRSDKFDIEKARLMCENLYGTIPKGENLLIDIARYWTRYRS